MQPQSNSQHNALNYYTILGLPPPHSRSHVTISENELKAAYHRTLLLNHPDKIEKHSIDTTSTPQPPLPPARYSVDDIMRAYRTLLEPRLKAEYDKQLLSNKICAMVLGSEASQKGSHLGVETYDLDDLTYHEHSEQWSKSCRCGDEDGYMLTELELETESKVGEIYVGCRGCSLFIKVLFSPIDEKTSVEE